MRVPGIPYVQGRNDYTDTDGRKYGIAIHNTANDASAEGEAAYAQRRTDGVSSHFYVDANSVIQSLDTDDRAGHAGSSEGNNHAIAVEITGTNDRSRAWWLANVAWDQLGAVLAVLCKRYGIAVRRASVAEMDLNPRVTAFYGHNDMRLAWGGTTHTDPGPNFPWDRLFEAVNAHMEDNVTPAEFVKILDDPQVSARMRALPWQYVGGGIPAGTSTLGVLAQVHKATAGVPVDLVGRLDAILAAALDDGDVTVQLDPAALLELQAIRAGLDGLPTEADVRDAVADLGERGAAGVRAEQA